jgi:cytoskeletal protein CcmA (bactofilin family)
MAFGKSKTTEQPAGTPAPAGKTTRTLISNGSRISGKIVSSCDMCVEGEVKGVIEIDGRLIVAPGGQVFSESLSCRNAEISGSVEGPLTVYEVLKIRLGGVVKGDIAVADLLIEQGGSFDGTCRKLKGEELHPRKETGGAEHARPKPTADAKSEQAGASPK